ncbi:MAG: cell wall hydrolase [Aliishimia sp.]
MRTFAAISFVLSVLASAGAVSASDDAVRELQQLEQRGLSRLKPGRMEELLSAPTPSHSGVQFSKAWLDAQPSATGGESLKCLSEALYFEARGETVKGQFAVAEVIVNRVKSSRFPSTICGVINQGTGRKYACQFTYTCDGRAERIGEPATYVRVQKVAKAMLDGRVAPLTSGATHYHTTAVRPKWARVYTRTAKIGVHIFYRHTYRSASN